MPRDKQKPENVHVFLYRENNGFEYAVFQRKDNLEWWQGISGGVEKGETLEQAALISFGKTLNGKFLFSDKRHNTYDNEYIYGTLCSYYKQFI